MTTLTSADLGLSDSNPFADEAPAKTTESKPSSRMKAAATSGVAPPVTAPQAVASEPAPPVLQPTPTASAPALPQVQNPATTGDFWKGAMASTIPTILGGLGLAAGGYGLGRGIRGTGGGAVPPPVDEEMRQLKLAQEQAKHEALLAENQRRQELHDARLANEAKTAEARLQNLQGKAASPTNADQQATNLLKKSEENKLSKAVYDAKKPVTPPAPPVAPVAPQAMAPAPAPAPTVAPTVAQATTPEATPDKAPTAKQASTMKEISLPKEWPSKGMNWITSQYGVEGAKQFIDTYNDGKPFKTHDEMKAVYDRVMTKPSFSSVPKSVRQERGIKATERETYKIVPGAIVPPQAPSGGSSATPIRGGGGGISTGRPGEELIHNLNPLKL